MSSKIEIIDNTISIIELKRYLKCFSEKIESPDGQFLYLYLRYNEHNGHGKLNRIVFLLNKTTYTIEEVRFASMSTNEILKDHTEMISSDVMVELHGLIGKQICFIDKVHRRNIELTKMYEDLITHERYIVIDDLLETLNKYNIEVRKRKNDETQYFGNVKKHG